MIGTGRIGSDKIGGLKRSQQPLASPWCLCIVESPCKTNPHAFHSSSTISLFIVDHKTVLLIAMAGLHQIWAYAFEETQWWNNM